MARIDIDATVQALLAAKTPKEFDDIAETADNYDLPKLAKAYIAAKLGQAAADAFQTGPRTSPLVILKAMMSAHLRKQI